MKSDILPNFGEKLFADAKVVSQIKTWTPLKTEEQYGHLCAILQ